MPLKRAGILLAVLLLAIDASSSAPRHAAVLEKLRDIPLPGPAVRFDYQCIDTTANRLYISHMGAGELIVFNLARGHVEGVVRDLHRVTGVWAVPALGKVYASVAGQGQVAIIDAHSLRVVARVGPIGFPDGIAYAPGPKKVYVSDESGGGELVIDGPTNRVLTTIPLGGEAGNSIFDPGSGNIFVAVQTRNEIVEIDPGTDRIAARHELAGAARPHGKALDPLHRLLFVANEGNASMLAVDLKSNAVVEKNRVGNDPDVLAYDPGRNRLFVASESGTVSVFAIRVGRAIHEGDVTMPHAHTVSVDPRTHLVYFPLQSVGGRPVLRVMSPPP